MNINVKVVPGVGEVGIDAQASPGNGPYYVKHYRSNFDMVGYDSEAEALEELLYIDTL